MVALGWVLQIKFFADIRLSSAPALLISYWGSQTCFSDVSTLRGEESGLH